MLILEIYGLMIIWFFCVVVGFMQSREKMSKNTQTHEINSLFDFFIGKR